MMFLVLAILLLSFSSSRCTIIIPFRPLLEAEHLTVTCIITNGPGAGFLSLENETGFGYPLIVVVDPFNTTVGRFNYGPVSRTDNGRKFVCRNNFDDTTSATEVLEVVSLPSIAFSSIIEAVEGEDYTACSTSYHPGNPPVSFVSVSYGGSALTNGSGVVVLLNSSSLSVVLTGVHRSRSGVYHVTLTNTVGNTTANFTLDVVYPPELSVNTQPQDIPPGGTFTFNCTPVSSNSRANVTFKLNSSDISDSNVHITGYVLTIPSVQRSQRGMYSCVVTNRLNATSASIEVNVIAPPTVPRGLSFSNTQPFSSTVSWSAPEDNGGDLNPPTYRINLTWSNGTMMMYTSTDLMLQLTNLWHSLNYTVSVVAVNKYGTSPLAERVLTTPDSVPIIASVSVKALSLSDVQVNITLLTDGGQSVEYHEVTISGTTKRYTSSESIVSFVAKGYSLSNKVFYNASVVAKNSVGWSQPFSYMFFVPSAPNITSPPTPLEPNAISTCCAGVKLNLADPSDPTLVVKVYRSGVLHPNTSHDGDNLTISGLQAGMEYTFRVTMRNVFGTSKKNLTLTPVLGRPSNPALPNVTVEGTVVTVVLSTAYPGTERTRSGSNFLFQLEFTKGGISTHQSNSPMQPFTPSTLTTPVNSTYSTSLDSGTYTVRVTAVNEHGSSESVMSEAFVVTVPPTSPENMPLIIGVVVAVIADVIVALIIFFCLILCMKVVRPKKETDGDKNSRQSDPLYDQVEAKTDSDIITIKLESNAAYETMTIEPSVTDPTYEEIETKLQLTANPAYEPIGLSQTSKQNPVYSNFL